MTLRILHNSNTPQSTHANSKLSRSQDRTLMTSTHQHCLLYISTRRWSQLMRTSSRKSLVNPDISGTCSPPKPPSLSFIINDEFPNWPNSVPRVRVLLAWNSRCTWQISVGSRFTWQVWSGPLEHWLALPDGERSGISQEYVCRQMSRGFYSGLSKSLRPLETTGVGSPLLWLDITIPNHL